MKKIVLILAVTIAMICSAGCVSTSNNIIGTWTSDKITDFLVPDVTQIIIVFNNDGKGTETWVYNDGGRFVSNMSWIENEDGSYAYAYDSWLSTLSDDGKTICDDEGRTFFRVDGDTNTGYAGTWTTCTDYEYNGKLYSITDEIYPDNTGISLWTDRSGVADTPWKIVWYTHNESTFINYYNDALVIFTISEEGKGIDSDNFTYTKS